MQDAYAAHENDLIFMRINGIHFHTNTFAQILILTFRESQRQKATYNWPIHP